MLTPFFIVGCGRSGSTLLQSLLDGHPNIAIPPESMIYERVGRLDYGSLEVRRNRHRFIHHLLTDAHIRAWKLDVTIEEVDRRTRTPTRAWIIASLFQLYAERHGAKRWGDKSPKHMHYLHLIRSDFPNAKLIHLVRDGRDTAEAYQRMIYGPVSAVGLARLWKDDVMPWRRYQEATGSVDMLEVRYEDMVTNTQDTLRQLLDFIGEPYVDTSSSYAQGGLAQTISVAQHWHSSLRGGISASKIGIYRKRFSQRDIEIIEAVAGPALQSYGYELDNPNPQAPSLWDKVRARLTDPLVRWWRKSRHPAVFMWDLQFKLRLLVRRARVR